MFIKSKSSQHLKTGISLILILFMMLSLISPNMAYGATATAKLSEIKGEVFVKKEGGQKEFKAVEGMLVSQGDWIRTGQDSSALIVYENGTETVLAANTQIRINTLTADSQGTQSSVKL